MLGLRGEEVGGHEDEGERLDAGEVARRGDEYRGGEERKVGEEGAGGDEGWWPGEVFLRSINISQIIKCSINIKNVIYRVSG